MNKDTECLTLKVIICSDKMNSDKAVNNSYIRGHSLFSVLFNTVKITLFAFCCFCTENAKYENGEWKSRTYRELEEMSKGENIVKWIKGQRISWLGHLERMEEDRMPKKSSFKNWKGLDEWGRPR